MFDVKSWIFLATMWGASAAALAADPAPRPVYSRERSFSIPFRAAGAPRTRAAAGAKAADEMAALHVSADAGRSWLNYATLPVSRRAFTFTADADGEYWFAVTPEAAQPAPRGAAPGLHVIVDTVAPQLELEGSIQPNGELHAVITVGDPHLDPATLSLEYRPSGDEEWAAVDLAALPTERTRRTNRARVAWLPVDAANRYELRAEVSDLAGNVARRWTTAAAEQPSVRAVSRQRRSQTPDDAPADDPPQAQPRSDGPSLKGPSLTGPSASNPSKGRPGAFDSHEWGADESSTGGLNAHLRKQAALHGDGERGDGLRGEAGPTGGFGRGGIGRGGIGRPAENDEETVETSEDSFSSPAAANGSRVLRRAPVGVKPRMVNSNRFQLDYDVESIGPSGIRTVELWQTRDGGRNWEPYGRDGDNQSPILVEVAADGIYGFRVIVQSGNGSVESGPQSGDVPEIWIGVDRIAPQCRLTQVEQGAGERAGQLYIHWQATDDQPMNRPVTLSFSEQPDGPFTTISSALANTGRFAWQVDQRIPDAIYIRIEVRDQAGNVAEDVTQEPVLISRHRPRGRIRDVRTDR